MVRPRDVGSKYAFSIKVADGSYEYMLAADKPEYRQTWLQKLSHVAVSTRAWLCRTHHMCGVDEPHLTSRHVCSAFRAPSIRNKSNTS